MKTIHLSDTHVCPLFKQENAAKLNVVLRRLSAEPFDHLAITGDLTDNADVRSLRIVRDVLKSHGLLRSGLATVVPGNHDIFGTVRRASDFPAFVRRCAAADTEERIRIFRDEFGELFEGAEFTAADKPFPFLKTVNGVSLIGIDSSAPYSVRNNFFASAGRLTGDMLNDVDRLLAGDGFASRPKILLAHHGFRERSLRRGEAGGRDRKGTRNPLLRLREMGVGAVLYGHTHVMDGGHREGILFANAGGSIDAKQTDMYRFNEVDYDGRSDMFNLTMRSGVLPGSRTERPAGRMAADKLWAAYEGG
ncbi:MAG: metallophosphoesterase [Candidatus Aminicenantes bacterium]|nr:metallophosphoesterase [Candidatus Aminicenantes bacterium]